MSSDEKYMRLLDEAAWRRGVSVARVVMARINHHVGYRYEGEACVY